MGDRQLLNNRHLHDWRWWRYRADSCAPGAFEFGVDDGNHVVVFEPHRFAGGEKTSLTLLR